MKRHYLKNLVVTMAVGTVLAASGAPANLKAITTPDAYAVFSLAALGEAMGIGETPEVTPLIVEEISAFDLMVEKLAYCESTGNPKALNPHDAGSPSYGLFQYKASTWKTYIRKYNLVEGTDAELMRRIYDADLQRELTKKILEEESGGWQHWYTCSRKAGLHKLAAR